MWRQAHKQQEAERWQRYIKTHRQEKRDRDKRYKEKNREQILAYHRWYNQKYFKGKKGEEIRHKKKARRLKLRFQIFKRDHFQCKYCGKRPPEVILEIDHIHPRSKGGKNNPDNYITACRECNLGKGDSILLEFEEH